MEKIHPALQQRAKKLPRFDFSRRNLWLIRLAMRLMPTPRIHKDVVIENILIPGQDDRTRIRVRIYKPKSAAALTPALIWLHGGGYVIGKPEMGDVACAEYAREVGITVASVDYRYAPEHRFPTGLEDSYSALKWVESHSRQLGIDSRCIAIGGDSAGGGLAAALVQLAHDRREIRPVFQLLIYPMLDDRTAIRDDIDGSNHIMWSQKSNRFGWESYLGKKCGAEGLPAYSVPARRADLSGLPPAWIGVGTVDLFHDEDAAYAGRLKKCGVECELYTVPGAFHGFDNFDPEIQLARDFRKSQIAALKKYLFPFDQSLNLTET